MGRNWIADLMPKHAQFSVEYGRQIKTVVDGSQGTPATSRGGVRQFSNSPGNFRIARVIAVGTGLAAAACEVEVYGIRFTVTEFPEAVGAQTLSSSNLLGTETFAAAGVDDYIEIDDYVGIQTWNGRHWIVQRLASCPTSSGGSTGCYCSSVPTGSIISSITDDTGAYIGAVRLTLSGHGSTSR